MTRANFLTMMGAALLAPRNLYSRELNLNLQPKFKAIVFDAFPIFDPAPVFNLTAKMFPEHADSLVKTWKIKQFEYTWLRSMAGSYVDFLTVTKQALTFAAKEAGVVMTESEKTKITDAYFQLQLWPEVSKVLTSLTSAGYRLGFLSNFTPQMLEANCRNNGISNHFEQLLSVDDVKKFKPDPKTYQMGIDKFHLKKEEILFVAFAGWDAAGAKQFGYNTFWVNRPKVNAEELGVMPDGVGNDLNDLLSFINR